MKYLLDIIPYDNGKSGISAYCRGVARAIAETGNEIALITEPGVLEEFGKILPPEVVHSKFFQEHSIEAPAWTRKAAFSMLWHLFLLPGKIKKSGADAVLILAANRRALYRYPLPTVAVVHDLSQYHVPAKYDAFRMFYIKHVLPHYVRKAHSVVAISKSTQKDLAEYWHIPTKKLSVVYDGFDSSSRPATPEEKASSQHNILYISRLEHPGKNHVGLIEAYGMLPPEMTDAHPLVLAGSDWNGAEAVHAAAEKSPYREKIHFTGFVPFEAIDDLWNNADAYCFPSRFEGFGLSLLESMQRGVPCCCSNTSSLGELGENIAELFDPEKPEEIAEALKTLLTSDNTKRIADGQNYAKSFTWQNCAQGLLDAFVKPQVFGVKINTTTMEAALNQIDNCVEHPQKTPAFFAFVNAHCLNLAYNDQEYKEILSQADAVWPDGIGVKLAGRKLGFPVPENVNGTDMFPLLAKRAAQSGKTLFLYGARPGVAEKAAENAVADHPGLRIAGTCDGFASDEEAIQRINAAKPDILLVALGVPKQEKWIAEHRQQLDCKAVIAVGGLLDFISGRIPRAPQWMRKCGLEWLYRLYQEPVGKFRRYVIGNPLFLLRLR